MSEVCTSNNQLKSVYLKVNLAIFALKHQRASCYVVTDEKKKKCTYIFQLTFKGAVESHVNLVYNTQLFPKTYLPTWWTSLSKLRIKKVKLWRDQTPSHTARIRKSKLFFFFWFILYELSFRFFIIDGMKNCYRHLSIKFNNLKFYTICLI